ncbi:MAG: DNA-deoxyinosine glycosylase [Mariprofundaceae bacterium]|nr:DNA-deoxyinosine glycosylase [Mariprofundaceae bacterium]
MRTNLHTRADYGFPAVSDSNASVLILGSMPSRKSLDEQQYYAYPRNAFWPVMGALFDFGAGLPYEQRLEQLKNKRIALWDVAHCCVRPGSLDADMREVEANDFIAFFAAHTQVRHVFFNGRKAEELFRRMVLPRLSDSVKAMELHPLPSTSPAHAGMSREQKQAAWGIVKQCIA